MDMSVPDCEQYEALLFASTQEEAFPVFMAHGCCDDNRAGYPQQIRFLARHRGISVISHTKS